MNSQQFLGEIEDACGVVGNKKKHQLEILASLTEEVGELAVEIKIKRGLKNKTPGPDGIVGEAVDVILCAMDIIHSEIGEIDCEEVIETFEAKINKWKRKTIEKRAAKIGAKYQTI